MTGRRVLGLAILVALGVAGEVRAQDSNAGTVLRGIFAEGAFTEDETRAVVDLFQAQTTTFPIGSSAGGFTWTFDPQLGLATRRSESFGPMFAERPLTNGRGKVNLSVAFQHTDWQEIAGQELSSGNLVFEFVDLETGVRDALTSELTLSTDRTIVNATFGVHDQVDLGIQVPFGRTKVGGRSRLRETRISDGTVVFDVPIFEGEGSSFGLGDVVVRGKVGLPTMDPVDLAAGIDVRLPTGDEDKLLGSGKASAKVMGIGSVRFEKVTPHFNIGYTFAGKGLEEQDFELLVNPSDEFDYTFGADVAATPRVTIAGDVIGRSIRSAALVTPIQDEFGTFYIVEPRRVNLLLGTLGAKVQVGSMWLITGAVAFPLNSAGVKPGITPVIGFERAF